MGRWEERDRRGRWAVGRRGIGGGHWSLGGEEKEGRWAVGRRGIGGGDGPLGGEG